MAAATYQASPVSYNASLFAHRVVAAGANLCPVRRRRCADAGAQATRRSPLRYPHRTDAMQTRNAVRLDEPTRLAAKTLAAKLDISPSEAVRRALVHYRDEVLGVPADARRRRTAALDRLCVLFEGHDATEEIRQLKAQDRHW